MTKHLSDSAILISNVNNFAKEEHMLCIYKLLSFNDRVNFEDNWMKSQALSWKIY